MRQEAEIEEIAEREDEIRFGLTQGLLRSELDQLPVVSFNKAKQGCEMLSYQNSCIICMEEYKQD